MDRLIECRYVGQEHAIAVAIEPGMTASAVVQTFNELHTGALWARFEMCRCKSRHCVCEPRVAWRSRPLRRISMTSDRLPTPARREAGYCFAQRGYRSFAVYERSALAPGHRIEGPAIIDEGTSTTIIHSDQAVEVDDYGNS